MKKPILGMRKLLLGIFLTLSSSCYAGPTELKSAKQFVAELRKGKPIVVEFSAKWCGHCQDFRPTYEKLSKDFSAPFFVIDIDNPAMGINEPPPVPTVAVMTPDGQEVTVCQAIVGNESYENAQEGIAKCLLEAQKQK